MSEKTKSGIADTGALPHHLTTCVNNLPQHVPTAAEMRAYYTQTFMAEMAKMGTIPEHVQEEISGYTWDTIREKCSDANMRQTLLAMNTLGVALVKEASYGINNLCDLADTRDPWGPTVVDGLKQRVAQEMMALITSLQKRDAPVFTPK